MNYTIGLSSDGTYIVVTVQGDITRQTAMQFIVDSNAMGKELSINRYLIDVTEAVNTDTVTEDYEFAYSDLQRTPNIDPFARVAILVRPGDHSHDFAETVSRNAGFDLTIFTDRQKAVHSLTRASGTAEPYSPRS